MTKISSLLGFAQKAGKVLSGEQGVKTATKRRQIKCLIIAEDSSDRTKQNYRILAHKHDIPCYIYGKKEELGTALGKAPRAVAAVLDKQIAQAIIELCRNIDAQM